MSDEDTIQHKTILSSIMAMADIVYAMYRNFQIPKKYGIGDSRGNRGLCRRFGSLSTDAQLFLVPKADVNLVRGKKMALCGVRNTK